MTISAAALLEGLIDSGRRVESKLDEVSEEIGHMRRVIEALARDLSSVRGDLLLTLPEIHTRLTGLERNEESQQRALREMAQVVVGHSEVASDALENVRKVADAGNAVQATAVKEVREASAVIRTLASEGNIGKKTGPAAIIHEISEWTSTFDKSSIWTKVILAVTVGALGLGWVLRATGH